MLKKLLCIVMVSLMAVTLFAACNDTTGPDEDTPTPTVAGGEDTFTFRLAETHADDYPTTLGDKEFARLVEEKTDGRIKIEVYAGSVLGEETAVIEQVQMGAIDFTRVSISPLSEFVPALQVLQLPYIYKSGEHMWRVLEGEVGKDILGSLETSDSDMVGLCWYDGGSRNFYLTSPVTEMADLKDKKIRVQESEMMMDLVEAVGAIPNPMPFGEVYGALQTGVIDGAENNFPSYLSTGHYEVATHFIADGHTRVPEILVASKDTMDKLSAEDQQAIKDAAWESMDFQKEKWAAKSESAKAEVEAEGCTIVEPSDDVVAEFQEAVSSLYDKYAADEMDTVNKIKAVN